MKDEYTALGRAIGDIAACTNLEDWLWSLSDRLRNSDTSFVMCDTLPQEDSVKNVVWMTLVSTFGDWGTSIMSGWIEHCTECADFIDECTARRV